MNPISRPYDGKNEDDFAAVTGRILAALSTLETDHRIKLTEENLAKLAQCSRGTLRNREWPIEALKKLKREGRGPAKTTDPPASLGATIDSDVDRIERYRQQLSASRDEVLAWKFKHDDMAEKFDTLSAQNKAQRERIVALETRIKTLEQKLQGGVRSNVVPFKDS